MTHDEKKPEALSKDSTTKQELTDEELASIAGGRAALHQRADIADMKKMADVQKASSSVANSLT